MAGLRCALSVCGVALALAGAEARGAEPASAVFGAVEGPAGAAPAPIGEHARGCLAGGAALPESGPGWQAMRLSRGRNWGHPASIAFVERLARAARGLGWPGLLIGDIAQPRGGPMRSGHRSHQTGLDIDIWLTRPGVEPLSRAARERLSAASVVAHGGRAVNGRWTDEHAALLVAAAGDPAVARIFVHPAIKAALCRSTPADARDRLGRIRPWWGHDAHFHVRLACPDGAPACIDQPPPPPGDGCDETLAWWFSDEARAPRPAGPAKRPTTLADLPPSCAGLVPR